MTQTSTTMPAAPGPSLIPQAPAAPSRPEYIPEKFWDASKGAPKIDDLAKAYVSLEKRLGSGAQPAADQPAQAPETPAPPQIPAGLDISALTN